MSYILDALKKSDRERHEGEVPGLDAIHDRYPPSPRNRLTSYRTKYFFTAFSILLLIFIFSASWYLKKTSPAPVQPVSIKKKQSTNTATEKTITTTTPEPKRNDAETDLPIAPVVLTSDKKKILIPYQKEPSQEEETTVTLPPEEPAEIPGFTDLPLAVQEAIPELHFAGHTYAEDPSKRMIIINNNILREGDKVNSSLSLIEITWTGVILDYMGQQFAMGID